MRSYTVSQLFLLDLFTIYQTSDVKTDVDQEKIEVRLKIYQCIIVTAILSKKALINVILFPQIKGKYALCT